MIRFLFIYLAFLLSYGCSTNSNEEGDPSILIINDSPTPSNQWLLSNLQYFNNDISPFEVILVEDSLIENIDLAELKNEYTLRYENLKLQSRNYLSPDKFISHFKKNSTSENPEKSKVNYEDNVSNSTISSEYRFTSDQKKKLSEVFGLLDNIEDSVNIPGFIIPVYDNYGLPVDSIWNSKISEAFINEILTRNDWASQPLNEANHPPFAVANRKYHGEVIELTKKVGVKVYLTSFGSSDPESNFISEDWWLNNYASDYYDSLSFQYGDDTMFFTIPQNAKGKSLFLVLTVTDQTSLPLSRFRVVKLTID